MARMYLTIFSQMKKQLAQLDKWLDMATEHAKAKSFDPNVLMGVRLAPDQFPFSRQIQIATDTAKMAVGRVTGKDVPKWEDNETTLAELQTRVKKTIEIPGALTEKDFEGIATRTVTQPRWEGKIMSAPDYFVEHALPNFYFHLTTTYALLRHNGVPIGKRDYLGALSLKSP